MKDKVAVLLDTSFFIRFLNENDPLFKNADEYFRYFIDNDIEMLVSTVSIAEYCIGGSIGELPLRNIQIVPFNLNHAQKTGVFAKIAFQERRGNKLKVRERNIIPNDTKLFAQASCENRVKYYLSSDLESKKLYDTLRKKVSLEFQFIELSIPYYQFFGILDL